MDTQSSQVIKEVIDDLLKIRKTQLLADMIYEHPFTYKDNEEFQKENRKRRQKHTIEVFDIPLIKLNNLLNDKERYSEVLEIEKQMATIQAKQYITPKEFSAMFPYSIKQQENYRNRVNDPLPYLQLVEGGNITYDIEEVKDWIKKQDKKRKKGRI